MNMRWRLNSCRGQREDVSLLASGALPEAEQVPLREHLAHCVQCRQYYEEMVRLSGEFQQWASTESLVEAGAAFRARWRRSIEAADSTTRTSLLPDLIPRWSEWLWPSPVAWCTLAAVWVCLLSLQWAMSAQRATGHELAGNSFGRTSISFAQRQRELASLLESLSPPAVHSTLEQPRPRSQRRVVSIAT